MGAGAVRGLSLVGVKTGIDRILWLGVLTAIVELVINHPSGQTCMIITSGTIPSGSSKGGYRGVWVIIEVTRSVTKHVGWLDLHVRSHTVNLR